MLQSVPLRDQIIRQFDAMPPQLQQAARYILDHPQDIALVSMRELARSAGVQPSTMTRFAKFLGLAGYDDIRAHYAEAIRSSVDGLAARAMQREGGNQNLAGAGLAQQMARSIAAQVARLGETKALDQLSAAAERLDQARRIYVLGLRSCHLIAWHFHYVMALLGDKTVHLDGPAGTSGDGLIRAGAGDALLVVSINPYAMHSLELAELAREKGLKIITITDSEVSPLVAIADNVILCATESQSFFHTLAPALVISEILCALLADKDRKAALEALRRADSHLLSLNTYATAIPRRRMGR
ncbi:transcriptional regulator [Afipia sp. P52-10]|jgi:DNA-binding MurR/RpiR family transcriptional regulator|uniref:MurR/RpiR family transcriptional regulator n=1 Tax=Afipia sp. P52-10 TaxID=1429916 RepID=UPI0003DF1BEB|nr:MurR/RpiR family transcriptional regulator [Afipia sp. P52-10]ETR76960.1 transcriptional regulator [Afipia sp. P52-10]